MNYVGKFHARPYSILARLLGQRSKQQQNMRKKNTDQQPVTEPDDSQLFKDAMRGTRRLADSNRAHEQSRPPKPKLRPRPSVAEAMLEDLLDKEKLTSDLAPGETLEYRRPGLQDRLLRKLRRGQFPREDELDLHGLTVDQARIALANFLVRCQLRQHRCIRIIHGKGLRSGERGPVLKTYLRSWLESHESVMAVCPAQRNEGGTGAVYVLLRNRQQPVE